MDGGRSSRKNIESSSSQPGPKRDLNPWKGDTVPLLVEESLSGRKIPEKRVVNGMVRAFRDQLRTIRKANLDHLPQSLKEQIQAWVTKITNDFAREAHGTSGRFNPFIPKETKELNKHTKLENIYRDLKAIYDRLMEANTTWPLASTAVGQNLAIEQPSPQEVQEASSSGDRFEPTSLLKGRNVVTKLDFLSQPLREQVQTEIDEISSNFAQHLQEFLDPSSKDQTDQVRANTKRELGKLYNDARLRSMSERLDVAIGIKNEIKSIIDRQAFKDLQKDAKQVFMIKSQKEFEKYSQKVFEDYANLEAFSELLKLDARLIKISAGLRIVEDINDTINSIPKKPAFQNLQDDVKQTIIGQIRRVQEKFARYSQQAFADYTKSDALTKLDELYDVLTTMSSDLKRAAGKWQRFSAKQASLREHPALDHLEKGQKTQIMDWIVRISNDFARHLQEFLDASKDHPTRWNEEKELDKLHDVLNGLEISKAIQKRIKGCDQWFRENCPDEPSEPSHKPELDKLRGNFKGNIAKAHEIQSQITSEIQSQITNATWNDRSRLNELINSYKQEENTIVKNALNLIKYNSQMPEHSKTLATLMKQTEQVRPIVIYIIKDNNNAITDQVKQTLINGSSELHEHAYRSIMDAMRAFGSKLDDAITEAQQHVESFQRFSFSMCLTESDDLSHRDEQNLTSDFGDREYQPTLGLHSSLISQVNEIWKISDEIKEHQPSLSPQDWKTINSNLDTLDECIYKAISKLSTYSKSGYESKKNTSNYLKDLKEAVIVWQKKILDLAEENNKKYREHMDIFNKINERFEAWKGWFDRNCPPELQRIRDKFNQGLENATQTKLKIDREIGNNNVLKLEHLTRYREEIPNPEEMALEVIMNSSEVSRYYEDLTTLKERAEKAKEAAINGINRKSNLPDKEKQALINESSELFNKADSSRIDAVRACGPQEDSKQRDEAIVKAEKMVLEVEMNALKHSNLDDYQTLFDLMSSINEAAKMAKEAFNYNKPYKKEEKQEILENFNSLYKDAYHSIAKSIEICVDHEKSGKRHKAIGEAQQRVRSLKIFLGEKRYQSIEQRIASLLEWHKDSRTAKSSISELPIEQISSAQRLEKSINDILTGRRVPNDSSELDSNLEIYSEVCRKIEKAGIKNFIDIDSDKDVKQLVTSLMDRADKAYEKLASSKGGLTPDRYTLYNDAYNAMADYVMVFSRQRAVNQEVVSAQEEDILPTRQMLAEAEKQIQYLEHETTKERVADWQNWFYGTIPSIENFDNKLLNFKKFHTASTKITTIEQQVAEAKSGNDESILDHIGSYEKKARDFDILALDMIAYIPEVASFSKDLNHLLTQAEKAQEAAKDDLPDEEKQTLIELFNKARSSIIDAVRACGTYEHLEQIDYAITKAKNEVLQVEMIMLKHSDPEVYQTLSGLITTANKMAEVTVDNITGNQIFVKEEKQTLLRKSNSSYRDINAFIAQAVRICTSQEDLEQRKEAIREAQKNVKSFQFFLEREQFKSTKDRVADWQNWFEKNCPSNSQKSELQLVRRSLDRIGERATMIERQITEAEPDNDRSPLEHFGSYKENARRFENLALDLIRSDSTVSPYYNDVKALITQAEEAKAAATNEANNLSEEEKQMLRDADRSVRDAVRACGPEEDASQRDYTITKAKNEVLRVKTMMLKQSNLEVYQTLSGLITTANKMAEMAVNNITDNQDNTEEKQIIINRFNSLYKDTHKFIAQAVRIYVSQEAHGQGGDAIKEAQQHIESFQFFLKRAQFESTKKRVADWLGWFDKNCPPDSQEALQFIRDEIDQAREEATIIEQQITEVESGDNHALLKYFKFYGKKTHILDNLVWEVIKSNQAVYDDLRTLVTQAEEAKAAATNEANNLSEEEKQMLRDADRSVRDAVRAGGPKEDASQRDYTITRASNEVLRVKTMMLKQSNPDDYQTLSGLITTANKTAEGIINSTTGNQDYTEEEKQIIIDKFNLSYRDINASIAQAVRICTSQEDLRQREVAIGESQQHIESFGFFLERAQFAITKKRVADWLGWFEKNCPPGSQEPALQLIRDEIDQAMKEATEIEQQIAAMEPGDNESLLKYFKSYKRNKSKIDNLVTEVIKTNLEAYSYFDALIKQTEEAKAAVTNEANNLSEEEKQMLRDANRSVRDAVRACGPKEDASQRDYTITRASNKVLRVKAIVLKQSNPEDYQTLSGLITTANRAAEGIINDITGGQSFTEEEKQPLLNDFNSSYKDAYVFLAQAVSACETLAYQEHKNDCITAAEQQVKNLSLFLHKKQFESIDSRILSLNGWYKKYKSDHNKLFMELNNDHSFDEDTHPFLRANKVGYSHHLGKATQLQKSIMEDIKKFRDLQVTEITQQDTASSILNRLESSLQNFSTVCREIENAAISFSTLMGARTSDLVNALRNSADKTFKDIKISEKYTNNQQKADALYNNVYHAMAEVIKTSKIRDFNEEDRHKAYTKAEMQLNSLQEFYQLLSS